MEDIYSYLVELKLKGMDTIKQGKRNLVFHLFLRPVWLLVIITDNYVALTL